MVGQTFLLWRRYIVAFGSSGRLSLFVWISDHTSGAMKEARLVLSGQLDRVCRARLPADPHEALNMSDAV